MVLHFGIPESDKRVAVLLQPEATFWQDSGQRELSGARVSELDFDKQ
jgi:hypothetical protein